MRAKLASALCAAALAVVVAVGDDAPKQKPEEPLAPPHTPTVLRPPKHRAPSKPRPAPPARKKPRR